MMKADKTFYDKLREEIKHENFKTSCSFFTFTLPGAKKEIEQEPQISFSADVATIAELQEKIKGLQSQVELLEKRNGELTQENNGLRIPTTEKPVKNNTGKGYVLVEDILRWTYEVKGDELFISTIRNMLQDFSWDKKLDEDHYRETIKGYEKKKREQRNQPTNEIYNNFGNGSTNQVFNGDVTGLLKK
ncbi:MAG: hypothetical protein IJV27_04705 [Prevotella sp.]|nr:hypothetical protein [Prevotella sp.]